MTDLEEQLREFVEWIDDMVAPVDADDVVRSSPRPRSHRRLIGLVAAAAVVCIVAATAIVFVVTRDTDPDGHRVSTAPSGAGPTTSASTTTTTTAPSATTALPPLEGGGLTAESRAGFAGIGPVLLGMTRDEAAAAAHATVVRGTCSDWLKTPPESGLGDIDRVFGAVYVSTGPDGRISMIMFRGPISTISGIHTGSSEDDVRRTYGNVERQEHSSFVLLVITNDEGRKIRFYVDRGTSLVTHAEIALNQEAFDYNKLC